MDFISSTDAKKKLEALIDSVNSDGEPPIICSNKGNKAVLLSLDDFEWIQETMSMLTELGDDEDFEELLEGPGIDPTHYPEPDPINTDFIQVYQFKVALNGIRPPIWRRIEIPSNYTFWDLHVAIQDAMGWFDSHLHEFNILNPSTGDRERIGLPVEDPGFGDEVAPGWNLNMSQYFSLENKKALYIYDFGDDWEHTLTLEKILPREKGKQYPVCIKGKRACPPEDCGGILGYEELVEIMADPKHEEYDEMIEWVDGPFDPEAFDAKSIEFDDPRERWSFAFREEGFSGRKSNRSQKNNDCP